MARAPLDTEEEHRPPHRTHPMTYLGKTEAAPPHRQCTPQPQTPTKDMPDTAPLTPSDPTHHPEQDNDPAQTHSSQP